MKILKERETPAQNIAFLGIMSGVCLILSLISSFVPFVTIASIFILSIASALGTRLTKISYSIPFMFATAALMLGVSFFNIVETIFYLVPAVFCGGLYGILKRYKSPTSYTIMAVSLLSLGLNYLSVPISNVVTGINPIKASIEILGLGIYENVLVAFPGLLLGLGLIQTTLSHFLIVLLHDRFLEQESKQSFLLDGLGAIFFGIISLAVGLFVLEVGYIAFVAGVYFALICLFDIIISKRKILYILTVVSVVIGVFLIAFLSPLFNPNKGILLGAYYPIVFGLLLILLTRKKNADSAK